MAKNARKTATRKNSARPSSTPCQRSSTQPASGARKAKKVVLASGDETEKIKKPGPIAPDLEVEIDPIDDKLSAFEDDDVDAEALDPTADEPELEAEIEDLPGGSSICIDDPVRMYLMQMGEIPLLTRAEELSSAQAIEKTRTHFRHNMLASDFVLQGAVHLLEKVRDGALRLDRTIEVSVTNTLEKKRILL
ncbi:MAG TPA: sigma-70 factor domain-containing protein, partial [Pirellulales bacterium]|nr:sigma-70 factor domain-containing protein [Pirellulales bacterium]